MYQVIGRITTPKPNGIRHSPAASSAGVYSNVSTTPNAVPTASEAICPVICQEP